MIQIIESAGRFHADHGWLSTYWHFSFDTYRDPANMNWGPLRVFNDDVVQPGQGFPVHAHRDMEIVTVVLEGALEHQDNQGNSGVLRPGDVQVMSAGTGIVHSEFNYSKNEPLHLLQIWLLPRTKGRPPRWEQRAFPIKDRLGRFLPVVSSGQLPSTLTTDQDAVIYLSSLRAGDRLTHHSGAGRKAYLFVIAGSLALNQLPLAAGDQARIAGEPELVLAAPTKSEIIFLDLPV